MPDAKIGISSISAISTTLEKVSRFDRMTSLMANISRIIAATHQRDQNITVTPYK
jgi:hypothetical protein